ncbi:MAG: YkgJ family cysteine cluster protein [Nanoarchaeota archaeon]|nr:YkgJ family cysteine cluster protein [Nanoarchaeota archaeon]
MPDLIKDIEQWKKEYLSPYCLTKCKDTCCDLSLMEMLLTFEELVTLLGNVPDNSAKYKISKEYYMFDEGICPQYDKTTRLCKIHNIRPKGCRVYPLHVPDIENSFIEVRPFCQLSESDPEFKELEKIATAHGLKVYKVHSDFHDLE